MIVTRRRRKPFRFGRLILPLVAILLIVFAFAWPPSRNVIVNGPAAPVFRVVGGAYGKVAAPFSFAAQAKTLGAQKKQIAQLQSQLTDAQNAVTAKTKQIASMQSQIDSLQAQAAAQRGSVAAHPRSASAGANGVPASGASLAPEAAAALRRTGSYWGSMEPSNAAKVVQRLSPAYAAQVFATMSADAVGAILDALPPTYVAKVTQANPNVQH